MKKVLLVEDDKDLGMTLSENLRMENYYVDWLTDGEKVEATFAKDDYDIVLLDIMLPNKNGYQVLQDIRHTKNTPIIMLSARNQLEDKLKGLSLKADDYLTKPFHLKELFLRMNNLLRRNQSSDSTKPLFQIGKYSVDLNEMQIKSNNKAFSISETEAKALHLFYKKKNTYISREELISYIWGITSSSNTRSIDNLILKFRKIIEDDPAKPVYFISKRGLGYCLNDTKENI